MKLKIVSFLLLVTLISAFVLPATVFAIGPIAGSDIIIDKFFIENGGFTDDTNDARSDASADVDWPALGGSTLYFGASSIFEKIYFIVSNTAAESPWEIASSGAGAFQYYNGADWVDIAAINDTNVWTTNGIQHISFTVPGDWQQTTVNEASDYYVRVQCDIGCNKMISSFDIDKISMLSYTAPAAVPEFSTYVLFFTLCLAGFVTFKKTQANGMGRA